MVILKVNYSLHTVSIVGGACTMEVVALYFSDIAWLSVNTGLMCFKRGNRFC